MLEVRWDGDRAGGRGRHGSPAGQVVTRIHAALLPFGMFLGSLFSFSGSLRTRTYSEAVGMGAYRGQ